MNSYDVYLVASKGLRSEDEFLNILENSLKAGLNIVQLREKKLDSLSFFNLSLKVKKLCDAYNTPFVINDRIDIALGVDASGVHIGQKDLPLALARKILGKEKIIGLSVNCLNELQNTKEADYLGVGAVFSTPSKDDCKILGIDGLKAISQKSTLPVVAIGGIDEKNILELKNTNIAGVAVIRAIMDAKDPFKSTLNLKKLFEEIK